MLISRLPSGGGKGELHGASIYVEADTSLASQTVELYLDGALVKSGTLSAGASYLFTNILEPGTYTADISGYSESVGVNADDILNKNTIPLQIVTTVTINLTLEGAKEDTITITDQNGASVGVCVFPTGSTVGEVEINIVDGQPYTFTSNIAKDTTAGTSDYSKTVILYADGRHNMDDIGMVPTMTSNTTPSGEVIGYGTFYEPTTRPPFYAFANLYTGYGPATTTLQSIWGVGYKFPNEKDIKKAKATLRNMGNAEGFKIQSSVDGISWIDESELKSSSILSQDTDFEFDITAQEKKLYWRLVYVNTKQGSPTNIGRIQFYSKGIKIMPEGALYWYGNECIEKSSGYTSYRNTDSATDSMVSDSSLLNMSNEYMQINQSSINNYTRTYIFTRSKVNLIGYNSLHFVLTANIDYNSNTGISNTNTARNFLTRGNYEKNAVNKNIPADISAYQGDYYVMMESYNQNSQSGKNVKVYAIWLE